MRGGPRALLRCPAVLRRCRWWAWQNYLAHLLLLAALLLLLLLLLLLMLLMLLLLMLLLLILVLPESLLLPPLLGFPLRPLCGAPALAKHFTRENWCLLDV